MITREEAEKSFVLMMKDKNNDKITRIAFPEDVQIGTSSIPSELMLTGRLSVNTKEYKADGTNSGIVNVGNNDTIIGISGSVALASARVNLPNNPRVGQLHHIKDIFGTAGISPINVYGSGGSTIDSASFKAINTAYSSLSVYWNGSEWKTFGGGGGGGVGPTGPTGATGATGPIGPTGATGAAPTRYPTPDSNTLVRFKLDESAAPYYSTGTQNTLNLTINYGGVKRITGVYDNCIFINYSVATSLHTATVPANPSSTSLTVWLWFKPYTTSVVGYSWIFGKVYDNNYATTPPYVGFVIQDNGTGSGGWSVGITRSGTFSSMNVGEGFQLQAGDWQLLALTYDGTDLKAYHNGALAATSNMPGSIDYGPILGKYMVGGTTSGFNNYPGGIGPISVDNRVFTEAELKSIYLLGLGRY
jgi:hypothetical protein